MAMRVAWVEGKLGPALQYNYITNQSKTCPSMNQFRFWAIFGLAVNGIALIRGIGYAFESKPHFTTLSVGTALCSAIGLYGSALILKRCPKGFRLAKRQVWFVAAHEALAMHLSHNATPSLRAIVAIGAFVSAALLYKLFASPGAQQYSNQVELSAEGT